MVLFILYLIFAPWIWGFSSQASGLLALGVPNHYGLYGCVVLGAYLLLSIASSESSIRFPAFGTMLGNIAYPVFLLHWAIAIVVVGVGVPFHEKWFFIPVCFILINAASLLIYKYLDEPIDRVLRRAVREGKSPNSIFTKVITALRVRAGW
ncbi:hypothetical protein GCM10007053_11340 [Halioglobus pacificus]|uniref:Acyltransferase n=1 Tax=Parahalioglobus pacificus TaxID=930806 RepID=A0A918XFQ3_9GAMM|nr:hypothetical protein GCM10007053_11340 [Halioglobus pacificus]